MYLGSAVRRHVHRIPKDVIFTTRELLNYAKRNTVDKTLSEFVKRGYLIRLARGVFIKEGSKIPSIYKIAYAKARAFGKEISACSFSEHKKADPMHIQHFKQYLIDDTKPKAKYHDSYSEARPEKSEKPENQNDGIKDSNKETIEITYLISGSTSQFKCGNTIIRFKSACARKVKLSDDTLAARCIKKMWQIGKENLTDDTMMKIMGPYMRQDREFMRRILNWLPAWLSDRLVRTNYLDILHHRHNYELFFASEDVAKYLVRESPPNKGNIAKRISAHVFKYSNICG